MSKKVRRILVSTVTALVVVGILLALVPTALVPSLAKRSYPQISGEIKAAGLEGPVEIYRDAMGIPHIYTASAHDLFFAQGYVHAQDRFWQMDFWRHIGSGSLSEMFGKGQLETDAFLRTLGWKQTAEAEYALLSPEARAIVDAYAEGVNAYIGGRDPLELSLEYSILTGLLNRGYKIEPWTPIDSLTWGKAMAWDLRGNMDDEIERAILLKTLTPEQVAQLFPEYPADYPVIVPMIGENASRTEGQRSHLSTFNSQLSTFNSQLSTFDFRPVAKNITLMEDIFGKASHDIGSNSWVVSGKLTSSGKPLLANDMHLGIQMPSIWYQNDLQCQPKSEACPFQVTGFSFAGVPGVVAGYNDRVAWAFTNLGPDVQDLFIEKINPENPNQYEVNGAWVDFETRSETLKVAGGETQQITVRISRHGPIISDTYGALKDKIDSTKNPEATPFKEKSGVALPENYAIALAWTALTPNSPFEAIWGFDKAQNWDEFRAAARMWSVPAQNLAYADVDGNIGYQTPGVIPIRKNGDGTLPVPGWTGEYDWVGFIPFDELPYAFNPASGYIVAANNQANPRDYPYLITKDWDYGQRAARIVDMIENAPGKIDPAYIQSMHGDAKSLNAEALIPLLLAAPLEPKLAATRDQFLDGWDYQERADSAPAVLFEAFWWNLLTDTFADELPEAYWPEGGSRWYVVVNNLAQQPDSPWWDDKTTTDKVETRDDIFAKAFAEAVNCQLCAKKFGADISQWRWGALHTSTFRNATLGKSGIAPIEALFNRGPFETSGGKSLVNATGWTVGQSFEVTWLPSEREIVDLGNLNASLAAHTTGQSGHAYAPHYDDMIPLWVGIQYAPMWFERASVEKDAEGLLKLVP